MIKLVKFSDIARRISLINRTSWNVKICAVVTTRHIICIDTDGEVEFFRAYIDNPKLFYDKLWMLFQAMLNFDYYDVESTRVHKTQRYSKKLIDLWKKANEIKSLKLSLKRQ